MTMTVRGPIRTSRFTWIDLCAGRAAAPAEAEAADEDEEDAAAVAAATVSGEN